MLHHLHYREFTLNHVGKLVNHDDTIPEAKLEKFVSDTDKAWKKRSKKNRKAVKQQPPPPQYHLNEKSHKSDDESSGTKTSFLKSLFSFSSTKSNSSAFDISEIGYTSEAKLFRNGKFIVGSYESTPPYKAVFKLPGEKKRYGERFVDEIGYDKEKISFHDKSELDISFLLYNM